jgi:hypothetical protein
MNYWHQKKIEKAALKTALKGGFYQCNFARKQENKMLDLIELTNREVLFILLFGFAAGFIAGLMMMEPWVTRLQSELRNK